MSTDEKTVGELNKHEGKQEVKERLDGIKLRHETLKTVITLGTATLVILMAFKNSQGAQFKVTNWLLTAGVMLACSVYFSLLSMHIYAEQMCENPESFWAYYAKQPTKSWWPMVANTTYKLSLFLFIIAFSSLFFWAAQISQ